MRFTPPATYLPVFSTGLEGRRRFEKGGREGWKKTGTRGRRKKGRNDAGRVGRFDVTGVMIYQPTAMATTAASAAGIWNDPHGVHGRHSQADLACRHPPQPARPTTTTPAHAFCLRWRLFHSARTPAPAGGADPTHLPPTHPHTYPHHHHHHYPLACAHFARPTPAARAFGGGDGMVAFTAPRCYYPGGVLLRAQYAVPPSRAYVTGITINY